MTSILPDEGSPAGALTDAAVAEFLASHNDFLVRHGELLEQIDIGAPAQGITSLVTRQVTALRARNRDLRSRLEALLANAKANDAIFARMRKLTLALMDVGDEAALDAALGKNLAAEFSADHVVCFVADWTPAAPRRHLAGVQGPAPLATLFTPGAPRCGVYRPEEYQTVFEGASVATPGSIALVPLAACDGQAALAIGARDPDRFTPALGTIFLSYLGDVLGRTVNRLIRGRAPPLAGTPGT